MTKIYLPVPLVCLSSHVFPVIALPLTLSYIPEPPNKPESEKLQSYQGFLQVLKIALPLEFLYISRLQSLAWTLSHLHSSLYEYFFLMTWHWEYLVLHLKPLRCYTLEFSKYNSLCFWIFMGEKRKFFFKSVNSQKTPVKHEQNIWERILTSYWT